MRSRRKTIVLAAVLGISVLTGVAAWLARGALLERWWIHRLSSSDPQVRAAMVERLRRSGGDAAARALAERVVEGKGVEEENVIAALEAVFERARPETRVRVTRTLLREITSFDIIHDRLRGIDSPIAKLLAMASSAPETLEVFVEGVEHNPDHLLCVTVLVQVWPAVRARVEAWFVRTDPRRLEAFLEALYSTLERDVRHLDSSLARSHAKQAIDELARAHPRPEVRAIALVKAAFAAQDWSEAKVDLASEARAFPADPDPLVRTTALKLAGVFGGRDNVAWLKGILLGEKDPGMLATAIEARTLAAFGHDASSLLVAPGVVTRLHSVDRSRLELRPFDAEEIHRLESLLLEAKDSGLRDAASCALAVQRSGEPGEPRPREAALEVREWSVWREENAPTPSPDGADVLSPDLPPFVYRSRPGFEHIARSRVDPALPGRVTVRSAVFFHAPRPLVLTVRAAYLGGVPESRYPEATNLVGLDSAGSVASRIEAFLEGGAVTEAPIDPGEGGTWGHDRSASPRIDGDSWSAPGPFRRYAPWARSGRSLTESSPRGFGLEWIGLRAGWAPDLEGEPRPLPPEEGSTPWEILRQAGSSNIALGADRESFLFHEGSAVAPSPVVVAWEDRTRRALVLRTRDFLSLPHPHDWEDFDFGSLLRTGERIVPSTAHVPAVLVVRKEPGRAARGACLRNLPSRSPAATIALDGLDLEGGALREAVRRVLEGQGLTPGESDGFLASLEDDLLGRDGLRVLTVVPRWLHDAVLPLEITPVPERTTRVGILWKECDALEVRGPVPEEPAGLFGLEEPLEIEVSVLETRREPLEPGPATPFEIREDGLLLGIWPGQDGVLFAGDGRFIAHPKDGLTGVEVFMGDLETRQFRMQVRLPPPLVIEDYTFSDDGSRVGMIVLDGARYRLLVADVRAGALIEIMKDFGSLAWSHASRDGRILSFLEDGEPRLFDLETKKLRRVRLPRGAKAFYPMLTPCAGKMALVLETTVKAKDGDGETKRAEIALADLEARTLRRLARTAGTHRFPSISADGRKVLFTRGENGRYWLYLADLERSRLVRISPHGPGVHTRGVTDDGATVIFTNENGIWMTDLSTGVSRLAHEFRGFKIRDGGVSSDARSALLLRVHPETNKVLGLHHVKLDGK